MRLFILPVRSSLIFLPVVWSAFRICPTVAKGFFCFIIAQAPAACGAEKDVPEDNSKPEGPPKMQVEMSPVSVDEQISPNVPLASPPGASNDKNGAELE